MSLTCAERRKLASALRRYVYGAPTVEYDDAAKMLLLDVIDKFERWGHDIVQGTPSQQALDDLIQRVAPESTSFPQSTSFNEVFQAFYR